MINNKNKLEVAITFIVISTPLKQYYSKFGFKISLNSHRVMKLKFLYLKQFVNRNIGTASIWIQPQMPSQKNDELRIGNKSVKCCELHLAYKDSKICLALFNLQNRHNTVHTQ